MLSGCQQVPKTASSSFVESIELMRRALGICGTVGLTFWRSCTAEELSRVIIDASTDCGDGRTPLP